MSDKFHADHLSRDFDCLVDGASESNAAAFAASSGVNLRFHDNWKPEFFDGPANLIILGYDHAARHSHAVPGEKMFALIFVDLHCRSCCPVLFARFWMVKT